MNAIFSGDNEIIISLHAEICAKLQAVSVVSHGSPEADLHSLMEDGRF